MKVYFIPGLGADRRVFKNVVLPAGFVPEYIDWIPPLKEESLSSYTQRLLAPYSFQEPYILVGLSMGGMIATEWAHQHPPELLVLISSIPCSDQLPPYFRKVGKWGLHKWVPISLLKSMSVMKRFFTTETPEDKKLLREMIRTVDAPFIYWALGAILGWKMEKPFENRIHIHGTRDELLPLAFTQPTHLIQKGGHLLVMNRAAEVNRILAEEFSARGILPNQSAS